MRTLRLICGRNLKGRDFSRGPTKLRPSKEGLLYRRILLTVLTKQQWLTVEDQYASCTTIKALSQKFGLERGTIQRHLKKQGLTIDRVHSRTRTHNENAFAVKTKEALYWAGWLMADGCISEKKNDQSPLVCLRLGAKDLAQLEKFKLFLGSTHTITHSPRKDNHGDTYCLSVGSKKLVADLSTYGVIPRKTFISKALGGAENSIDFWRGAVEGDGTLYFSAGYPGLTMLGSWTLMNQFCDFIGRELPPTKKKNIFAVATSCRKAVAVVTTLYENAEFYLPRKFDIAKKMMEHYDKPYRTELTFGGETLSILEWSKRVGCTPQTIRYRIASGWSHEKTLTTPPKVMPKP